MRTRVASLVLVGALALGLEIGCKAGGGGSVVDGYVSKLEQCGLLSDGELPMLDDGAIDEEEVCYTNCLTSASCADLEQIMCNALDPMSSAALAACVKDCYAEEDGEFTCGDGNAIPSDWECDGEPDCADSSDEVDCVLLECADGNGTYPETFRCDGDPDCADGSDELNCPGYVTCADGNGATPEEYLCDGEPDCEDGSDEQGCPAYACDNGDMVVGGARCDLYQDCEDGSDEQGCAQIVCPSP